MVFIDGVSETEFKMKQVRGHTNPSTSVFLNKNIHIPGQLGLYDFGTEVNGKPLSIPIDVFDCDVAEANERLENFLKIFIDDLGKPKEVKVIFEYDSQRFYMAKLIDTVNLQTLRPFHHSFIINMMVFRPHRYSIVENDEITWGSEVLTFDNRLYTLGHEGGSSEFNIKANDRITIDVIGLALQPTIHLDGSATDLVIENKGKKISVGTFTNSTWEIVTEKYISYQNGNEKIIRIDKDWMLRNGLNDIQFTGSNIDLKATIRFRERWQ